jgi:hypothetical protein
MVAPLLLLTKEQAAVIQPLLVKAGLDSGVPPSQQQRATTNSLSGARAGSQQQQQRSVFMPLVPSCSCSGDIAGPLALAGPAATQSQSDTAIPSVCVFPCITPATAAAEGGGGLLLHCSTELLVHPGPGGILRLTGLVDATEQAWEVLQAYSTQQQQQLPSLPQHQCAQQVLDPAQPPSATHHPNQQQQQQQQQQGPPVQDVLSIPPASGMCLLRLSSAVTTLLMTHHPHPGVRQQAWLSGLLPLLALQEQVLACVLDLRQQLAAEHAAAATAADREYLSLTEQVAAASADEVSSGAATAVAGNGSLGAVAAAAAAGASSGYYLQLVLAGSCLGGTQGATSLMQSLLPFAREHAAAEWQQLCQLAVRQARAEGRRLGDGFGDAVAPWDVAHTSLNLVSAPCITCWSQKHPLQQWISCSILTVHFIFCYQECCRLHVSMWLLSGSSCVHWQCGKPGRRGGGWG